MARTDMSSPATYEDVNLVLRLYELRREEKLRQARAWFLANWWADSVDELMTKYPMTSDENRMARMVVTHWEMVASFIVSGVLNQELFFQSGREMLFVWTRVKHLAPEMRAKFKDPTMYRNLEIACASFIQWLDQQEPGAYAAFEARVISMVKK